MAACFCSCFCFGSLEQLKLVCSACVVGPLWQPTLVCPYVSVLALLLVLFFVRSGGVGLGGVNVAPVSAAM